MEKEPSFLIGICHNFPHCFSPSQGLVEVLIGLVLFSGLRDFFPLLSCICSYIIQYISAVWTSINTCLTQQLESKDDDFISDNMGFILSPYCWWPCSARVTHWWWRWNCSVCQVGCWWQVQTSLLCRRLDISFIYRHLNWPVLTNVM